MSWMECQDGGDPAVQVSPRDIVYCLDADAAAAGAEPRAIAGTDFRCRGVSWGTGAWVTVFQQYAVIVAGLKSACCCKLH